MERSVQALFERYGEFFNRALDHGIDMAEVTAAYASEFISASPRGVMAGKNDDSLQHVMELGFEHYRRLGSKAMRLRTVDTIPIDGLHCLARIGWTSVHERPWHERPGHERPAAPDVEVDFEVHYLVQFLDGEPRIFGWIAGDEQALLRQHGIG